MNCAWQSFSRADLSGRIEPYILSSMERDVYQSRDVEPALLLTPNRLDILARLAFLEMEEVDPTFGEEVYFETIRAQSDGAFKDPHNFSRKSFENYLGTFRGLSQSLKNGFSSNGPFVPLASDGSILNGAHRVAIALFNGFKVPTIQTELKPVNADFYYLQTRGVSEDHLLHLLSLFSKYAPDVYMAIFWPIAEKLGIGPGMLQENVGTVQLHGNLQMVKNIAYEAYKDMDWIGTPSDKFRGLDSKLAISTGGLREKQSVLVSIFQEKKGLDEVRRLKEALRSGDNGSTRAVHITDDSNETNRMAALLFCRSGRHFLRVANPFRFDTRTKLTPIREKVRRLDVESTSFAIDGSAVLGLFGLREPRDLDFLSLDDEVALSLGAEARTEQLRYHEEAARRLIQSPRFHFVLDELHVISLEQVARMKRNRLEAKDVHDLGLLEPVLGRENKARGPSRAARLRLFRVRFLKAIRGVIGRFLRPIGLEQVARRWYEKRFQ